MGNMLMVIDAHAHVWWYGYDAEKLVANMDEHGIDVAWLLSWEVAGGDVRPRVRRELHASLHRDAD